MDKAKQTLIELLEEAHSNELALINTLNAHIAIAEGGSYKRLLEKHVRETKSHSEKIDRRLTRLGHRRNLIAMGYGVAQTAVRQGIVLAKGPIDMVRGGNVKEKTLRNARDEITSEALEIATYDTIETVARGLGDHETAELAAAIRVDEEEMLASLRKEIAILAEEFARTRLEGNEIIIDEPWSGYDEMTVDEIEARLRDASESLLSSVRNYERKNKNRSTVIEATERETASI